MLHKKLYQFFLVVILVLCTIFTCWAHSSTLKRSNSLLEFDRDQCKGVDGFTKELQDEIRSKSDVVGRMMDLVLRGKERHATYEELALFCDTFGPRLVGSESLANAIEYLKGKMESSGNLDVRAEPAMIPKWEVHEQWAEIESPVKHRMSILALGKSVGTDGVMSGDVQLVHSFKELSSLGMKGQINGKIVVYNYNFTVYGESVSYRRFGAIEAAKFGARAALVRSVAPFSIYSPHTGAGSESIPTAAITIEDADLIERWTRRGKQVKLKLFIDAKNFEKVQSYNLIADIKGTNRSDEVVLVSGHMDSWYNTQGAMDDGGGMMISYKAVDLLQKLGLRARRTIRAALWTSEELDLAGALQYYADHKGELQKFKVVMESDLGTFKPLGLSSINFSPLGKCIVAEILKLTEAIGTTHLNDHYEGSDIEVFTNNGVPGLSLYNENSKYFFFHHTSGDSITVEDPDDLDKSTILWATAAFVLADLNVENY